jgi:excisionase family DNA binding protein
MTNYKSILREIRNLKREVKKSNLFRKRYYTMKEASIVAGISLSFIQKLVASNLIAHSRPNGKLIFIRRRDLEVFLMKNYVYTSDDMDTIVANNLIKLKAK